VEDALATAAASTRLAPDDRRKAILAIARDVFMTEGYAAASMSEIAARLGGSKGTLYNYFPSKEALFAEFLRSECSAEAEGEPALIEGYTDVREALRQIGRGIVRRIFSDTVQAIHRLVIAESARFPELGRTFYENGPKVGILRGAGYLQRWMDEGKLKRTDAIRASERFGELCKAGLYQRSMWAGEKPTQSQMYDNVDEAVDIFLAYYGA
jgi:TetR/AcrR family transcriptional repressor of mexJK operon